VGHHRRLAGAKPGLGGAVFGGVGVGAGLLAGVMSGRRAQDHQVGRLELDAAFGERVLNALVLADRPNLGIATREKISRPASSQSS
jgi:hypothetical protein